MRVGDTIIILKNLGRWASSYCKNCPLGKDIYPYTGVVHKIDVKGFAHIGNYGWDINFIEYVKKEITYEIY